MGRTPRFTHEALISLAVQLAAAEGPAAVTMLRLGAAAKASNGSLYHRFESRAALLGSVWVAALERFQTDWWATAESETDPGALAVGVLRWARSHRELAKVLLVYRAEDFVSIETPAPLAAEARRLQLLTRQRWEVLTRRLLGCADAEALERVQFALAGIPLAALRTPLTDERPITRHLEQLVRKSAAALLEPRR
jgi:AcrR family transcriptional regulator